jgi:hypothetical protein
VAVAAAEVVPVAAVVLVEAVVPLVVPLRPDGET